jgi:hypothetical protein
VTQQRQVDFDAFLPALSHSVSGAASSSMDLSVLEGNGMPLRSYTPNFYDRCAHKDRIFERWLALLTLAHYYKFYSSLSSINCPSL